ncbi:hypothetical protein DEI93_14175 [Curtobacterium sp. MCBD17_035]|uniref:hypothetical protein n=1 Tax=Curtobacterium sp. MCBD17_035 TaxID=2175673 RepID=UPI0024DF9E48|nr:hypothetical protein [Curtobacterium sp. MCBD17_035]WIB67087.1 hypothetical protein DEI93_14175 [Curtobacterium sp. MCBD17_035]
MTTVTDCPAWSFGSIVTVRLLSALFTSDATSRARLPFLVRRRALRTSTAPTEVLTPSLALYPLVVPASVRNSQPAVPTAMDAATAMDTRTRALTLSSRSHDA